MIRKFKRHFDLLLHALSIIEIILVHYLFESNRKLQSQPYGTIFCPIEFEIKSSQGKERRQQSSQEKYFAEIVSIKNIKEAYNELKEKFYNPISDSYSLGKLARGIDGGCFSIFSKKYMSKIKEIRKELMTYKPSLPSIDLSIPKSSNPNKFRII